jgi:hypothetical protein
MLGWPAHPILYYIRGRRGSLGHQGHICKLGTPDQDAEILGRLGLKSLLGNTELISTYRMVVQDRNRKENAFVKEHKTSWNYIVTIPHYGRYSGSGLHTGCI